MQLQDVELQDARDRLERARVDLVVIEPTRSIRGMRGTPIAELVRTLRASPGLRLTKKRCVAYLNIGQAEDYRDYWGDDWRAPQIARPGHPDFLLGLDPDGWVGNYPVAFWRKAWRDLLWGSADAPLDQILADGFDGVYLDWILGALDPVVATAAAREGVDAAREMVDLVRGLRDYARARNPLFVVIAQNAVDLAEVRPELIEVVDGFAQEDLSFSGSSSADWGDAESGGIAASETGRYSTAELGARLAAVRAAGIAVLTIDYAVDPVDVEIARDNSRSFGLVPFVSRTPLDRLPDTLRFALDR